MKSKTPPKRTMQQINEKVFAKILSNSDPNLYANTTVDNVFQPAHKQNLHLYGEIIEPNLLPGSGIKVFDNLIKLHKLSKTGKSTLILSAHYSNYDVGALYTLLNREGQIGKECFDDMIFIAGRKLTEGDKTVKALSETFTRLVISAKSENMTSDEIKKAMAINKASQKKLNQIKNNGHIFYLYPTGTRIRLDRPKTHQGLREIYNYIRKFDYFLCCGIEGIILPARDDVESMLDEYPQKDILIYNFGEVFETKPYLKDIETSLDSNYDTKQIVIDNIMKKIYSLGQDPQDLIKKS